ncbi:hypothetical protein [Microbacterium invictum]|uniref:Chromosome segregation ATPase n=1 Tax=Microbacterium invictum TaxID=515415 RepID=A0AA40VML8_9MICO|nr:MULTISPECIES: hypothetical protein [Microbacterium]MBB4140581.1 chromosome segregation ATPase [Microbacterium invictum]
MTPEEVWAWAGPALVVFGAAAVLSTAAIWALRRSRRSPRARAAAEAERTKAGSALVRLDNAVDELDLEVGLSGALYDGTAPPSLRRARITAQRARDDAFEQFRTVTGHIHPDEVRRVSRLIVTRVDAALGTIEHARREHTDWVSRNVTAGAQLEAARDRATRLRRELGDPEALLTELSARFAPSEWAAAEHATREVVAALAEGDRLLTEAAQHVTDPTRSVLPDLARAERELRRAEVAARTLEENHRLVTDAAMAVGEELETARAALGQAGEVRAKLEPDDAERLGAEMRQIAESLGQWAARAGREPTATVDAVARLRGRLDLAMGDARTAQQRLRGARTALPGSLAAARAAIARAETAVAHAGADARVRLAAAQDELAQARGAADPVAALDAARRALRHAEDASALADYDRLTRD